MPRNGHRSGHGRVGRNPGVDRVIKRYKDTHWGIEPDELIEIDDPDLPEHLTMMGRLVELEVAPPGTAPRFRREVGDRQRGASVITFPKGNGRPGSEGSILAFCETKPSRLYNILDARTARAFQKRFWEGKGRRIRPMRLADLARLDANGRMYPVGTKLPQDRAPYPDILVKPLGVCITLVYETAKMDDAEPRHNGARYADEFKPVLYEHHVGEESYRYPWLGVDDQGRLWWAGGAYKVDDRGVVD